MGDGYVLSLIRILLVFIYLGVPINGALDQSENELPAGDPPPRNSRNDGLFSATLSFAMGHLGMIECEGVDKASDFLEHIFGEGVSFNRSDFLCGPTCRGHCVPRPRDVGIPPSIYPFGCSCEIHGCNEAGPIISPLIKPTFKIVCKQDPHCTCVGMGPGQYTGYSCSWMNTETNLLVTFRQENPPILFPGTTTRPSPKLPPPITPKFSPISWCSCCPRFPIVRND